MNNFNPLKHPVCFSNPDWVHPISGWHENIPFAMMLIDILRPEIIVELGTQYGTSYCAFCQAVKELKLNTLCYAVDTWRGDAHTGSYGPEVREVLSEHHDAYYSGFSTLIQSTFDQALPKFKDRSIDLLHIDGYHTYAAVKHDFEAWLPKMSSRGIVLLHDTNYHVSDFEVWKFWDEIKNRYPHFEFTRGSGLGVLAIGKVSSKELQALFNATPDESERIRKIFALLGQAITEAVAEGPEKRSVNHRRNLHDKRLNIKRLQAERVRVTDIYGQQPLPTRAKTYAIKTIQIGIDKLLSQGTRRRYYYELGLKGVRIIYHEGLGSFWSRYQQYREWRRPLKIKVKHIKALPEYQDNPPPMIDKKVSIIIPTKNAGPDFDFTLEKIQNQKGVREIETVVIDSGSMDQTTQISKNRGARVITIPSNQFNHGLTRNYGAEQSSGDYYLFLVQDAMPIGDYWLYDLVSVLENDPKIGAATCRQIPRSDADLFACSTIWNHYRMMEFSENRIAWPDAHFRHLSPQRKRGQAGFDDVCGLVKADVFNQLKFNNISYAEDLELGVRVLRAGYGIAFLYSNGVIHSHNRSPAYSLKRSYVDGKVLPAILEYKPAFVGNESVASVFGRTVILYGALCKSIPDLHVSVGKPADVISCLKTLLKENFNISAAEFQKFVGRPDDLGKLLNLLNTKMGTIELKLGDDVVIQYFHLLDNFELYLKSYSTLSDKQDEFINSLYHHLAVLIGSTLANYYLCNNTGKTDEKLMIMDEILSEGV